MKSKQYAKKIFAKWDVSDQKEKAKLWDQIVPLANAYPQLWYRGKRAPGAFKGVRYKHERKW